MRKLGVAKIDDLETDQGLQEAVLSVFHSMNHTFNGAPVAKLIENHLGKTFLKKRPLMMPSQIPFQIIPQPSPPPGPPASP